MAPWPSKAGTAENEENAGTAEQAIVANLPLFDFCGFFWFLRFLLFHRATFPHLFHRLPDRHVTDTLRDYISALGWPWVDRIETSSNGVGIMKVICDRGALVEALGLVAGVIVSRTPKPVLTCVHLIAADGTLTLAATDLEVAVRLATVRVEVQEAGEVLVPADRLASIVRDSPDATLALETEGDVTHIRGQDAHYKILGMPVADFPPLPQFQGEPDFTISALELTRLIQQTIYATARENSRYAINGVLFEREGGKLAVVATDGHRLAVAKGECQVGKSGDDSGGGSGGGGSRHSAIIPTKGLNTLTRLLGTNDVPVRVKIADNQILFATETALVASNLVEGNFPPYKDVVPRDADKKATLKTDVLASAFRRASLLTNEESKGVRMEFTKTGLTLRSRAPEMGEAEIKVEVPAYEGEPLEIGFNPQYVLDVLKVVGSDQIQIDLRASNKPGIIRSGTQFLYVIMPVNLQ